MFPMTMADEMTDGKTEKLRRTYSVARILYLPWDVLDGLVSRLGPWLRAKTLVAFPDVVGITSGCMLVM